MKTQFKILFSVAAFLLMGSVASAQSNTTEEVPGDNFSLEGALELFKKSASPQEFEQLLNSPDSKVNNLDLNSDGQIDYIRVTDKTEGNIHDFILQDVISSNESQDIAVIELEKRDNGTAVLQIVGDADIYGVETIIEPTSEVRVNAGTSTARTTVNVWAWPSVQYVYGPYYNPWISPWGWGYYAGWYRPWRPIVWASWYPYWAPYRPYYAMCYRHRIGYASTLYRPYRTTSMFVYNNNYNQINNFRNTSRSYQYNRSGYAHSNRYDNEHRWSRNNNSYNNGGNNNNGSYNGGRTNGYRGYQGHQGYQGYNSGRTRSDYGASRSDNSHARVFTPPAGGNNSFNMNRSRPFSNPGPSFHRSAPSSPSFRSAPSGGGGGAHFHPSPSHSSGGSHGGGGGHFRGH